MATDNKLLNLRKQIFDTKIKIWDLYGKMQVQKALENISETQKEDIRYLFRSSIRFWGGVELTFWLRAVAKIIKQENKQVESVFVMHLPERNSSDAEKIRYLRVLSKQIGLDIKIFNNRKKT